MKVAGFCAGRMGSLTHRESSVRKPISGPAAISFNDDVHVDRRSRPLSNRPISIDDHDETLQRTIAVQTASIKNVLQSKAQQQIADLMKVATKDVSQQALSLDKVIDAYSNKFRSIISWIEETEKIKEHIKELEEEVAATRASNALMAANHEENVKELQEQYEILQIQLRSDLNHQQKGAKRKGSKMAMPRSVSMNEALRYNRSTELPPIIARAIHNSPNHSLVSIAQQSHLQRPLSTESNTKLSDLDDKLVLAQEPQTEQMIDVTEHSASIQNIPASFTAKSKIRSTSEPPKSLPFQFLGKDETATDADAQVAILREKIHAKQGELQSLESSLASISQEPEQSGIDDRKTRDQIERIASIEDSVEKSLLEEIAVVKRRLAESKEAASIVQKKLAKQRKQNEKLRNQVATAENKCHQAQALLEQECENEQFREQNLKRSFQEQTESIIKIFSQIRDCVYQCKRVTSGLESGLVCSICLNEFQDPYLFSPCGHTCCHQCIPDTRLCPTCCHDSEAPSTTAIATNQLLRRIVEQYRWFTDPMTKAGDAIIDLCDQVLKRKYEDVDLPQD